MEKGHTNGSNSRLEKESRNEMTMLLFHSFNAYEYKFCQNYLSIIVEKT